MIRVSSFFTLVANCWQISCCTVKKKGTRIPGKKKNKLIERPVPPELKINWSRQMVRLTQKGHRESWKEWEKQIGRQIQQIEKNKSKNTGKSSVDRGTVATLSTYRTRMPLDRLSRISPLHDSNVTSPRFLLRIPGSVDVNMILNLHQLCRATVNAASSAWILT